MSTEKQFPQGLRVFKPHANAPGFVKAEIVINLSEFMTWISEQGSDIKLTVKESQKGTYYAEVNTYQKPEGQTEAAPKAAEETTDGLPF